MNHTNSANTLGFPQGRKCKVFRQKLDESLSVKRTLFVFRLFVLTLLWSCLFQDFISAQPSYYFPTQDERNILEKFELTNIHLFSNHLAFRPFHLQNTSENLTQLIAGKDSTALRERAKLAKIVGPWDENMEESKAGATHGFFKNLYRDGRHFYQLRKDHLRMYLDPILHLEGGSERSNEDYLYLNRRGIRLSGEIDEKFSFQTEVIETQQTTPSYVHDYEELYAAVPGAGFYKSYNGRILKLSRAYDYLLADASFSSRISKHIEVSLGHGRHAIGYGIHSLFLSEYAAPYFYLRLNTNIWRLHYQNLFAELSTETSGNQGNRLFQKKYMAAHCLSINLNDRWNVGLFESVIFARENQFEFQYLNPLILYRFVEHSLGSPDNVFLGLQSKYLISSRLSVYGQILLDELVLKEFFKASGWWGNKYGAQLGFNYNTVLGVDGLDLKAELNFVRPYTYSFRDSIANYSNFHQSLAHPLGANFLDTRFIMRYAFHPKWVLHTECAWFKKGLDSIGVQYGGNILLDYTQRRGDYDNRLFQGVLQQVWQAEMRISYQWFAQAWLEAGMGYRSERVGDKETYKPWFFAGMRMTVDRIFHRF